MEALGSERHFNRSLGGRLRAARRRRGLSLAQVEEITGAEFKASVVGAYERGERALSVHRLAGLAQVYGVSVTELIPHPPGGSILPPGGSILEVAVDLDQIGAGGETVDRFLSAIQLMRREGSDMAVRNSDLALLSSLLGKPAVEPEPR